MIVGVSAFEALASGTILGGRDDVSGLIQRNSPAALSVTPGALTFSLSQGAQAVGQPVTVVNQGSQPVNFTATASTSWLSVNPQGGGSSPGIPGIITVIATPGTGNNRVRILTSDGNINTVVGNGEFNGGVIDAVPPTSSSVAHPGGLFVDSAGNLLIADTGDGRIRKVTPGGTITTVAGTSNLVTPLGDGGPATRAFVGIP